MTITKICLSGGGPSLIKQLGAIQVLEENNYWKIENINCIFSTSAGAWLSIILCLKIDWETINNYIVKRPWEQSINMSIVQLYNIYNDKGIFDIEIIYIFFKPLFLSKNIQLDINLEDFYSLTNIELFFYTFEINNFKLIEISHNTQPKLKLLEALYMTSCIPLLFKPYIIKDENKEIKCYIDGGISLNYPLEYCLNKSKNKNEILSFKNIFNNDKEEDKIICEKTNTVDYIIIFLNKLIKLLHTNKEEQKEDMNMNKEDMNKEEEQKEDMNKEDMNKEEETITEIICNNNHITLQYLLEVIQSETLRNELLNDGFHIGKQFLCQEK